MGAPYFQAKPSDVWLTQKLHFVFASFLTRGNIQWVNPAVWISDSATEQLLSVEVLWMQKIYMTSFTKGRDPKGLWQVLCKPFDTLSIWWHCESWCGSRVYFLIGGLSGKGSWHRIFSTGIGILNVLDVAVQECANWSHARKREEQGRAERYETRKHHIRARQVTLQLRNHAVRQFQSFNCSFSGSNKPHSDVVVVVVVVVIVVVVVVAGGGGGGGGGVVVVVGGGVVVVGGGGGGGGGGGVVVVQANKQKGSGLKCEKRTEKERGEEERRNKWKQEKKKGCNGRILRELGSAFQCHHLPRQQFHRSHNSQNNITTFCKHLASI